jgi:hypothetical protein
MVSLQHIGEICSPDEADHLSDRGVRMMSFMLGGIAANDEEM